jgi:hypothetical protein
MSENLGGGGYRRRKEEVLQSHDVINIKLERTLMNPNIVSPYALSSLPCEIKAE